MLPRGGVGGIGGGVGASGGGVGAGGGGVAATAWSAGVIVCPRIRLSTGDAVRRSARVPAGGVEGTTAAAFVPTGVVLRSRDMASIIDTEAVIIVEAGRLSTPFPSASGETAKPFLFGGATVVGTAAAAICVTAATTSVLRSATGATTSALRSATVVPTLATGDELSCDGLAGDNGCGAGVGESERAEADSLSFERLAAAVVATGTIEVAIAGAEAVCASPGETLTRVCVCVWTAAGFGEGVLVVLICTMFGSVDVSFVLVSAGICGVRLTAFSSASDEFASETVLFACLFPPAFPLLIQLPIVAVAGVVMMVCCFRYFFRAAGVYPTVIPASQTKCLNPIQQTCGTCRSHDSLSPESAAYSKGESSVFRIQIASFLSHSKRGTGGDDGDLNVALLSTLRLRGVCTLPKFSSERHCTHCIASTPVLTLDLRRCTPRLEAQKHRKRIRAGAGYAAARLSRVAISQ